MNPQQPHPTKLQLTNTPDYRENYANSVQVRVSLWDFFLSFGTLQQNTADTVDIRNFQGLFLSPQQAKALANVLQQNVVQYENTFGPIKLDPQPPGKVVQ
jgi:flagellar protein FlaG